MTGQTAAAQPRERFDALPQWVGIGKYLHQRPTELSAANASAWPSRGLFTNPALVQACHRWGSSRVGAGPPRIHSVARSTEGVRNGFGC